MMCVQGGQGKEAYLDADGAVHWPVLFLYDEFDQSDYFQVVCVRKHMRTQLCENTFM